MLNFDQLKKYLESIQKNKLIVAFFINNAEVSQDEWMNPFAEILKNHDYFTIGIVTPYANQTAILDKTDISALIEANYIKDLPNIDIFIVSDMDEFIQYPQNSRILASLHALLEKNDSYLGHFIYAISQFDGLLVPFPISDITRKLVKKLWSGFYPSKNSYRKSKTFSIIPHGHPRLAIFHSLLKKQDQIPDSIIYAPHNSIYPDIGGKRIKLHGIKIIRNLLQTFPKLNIIFRPYKTDLETETINNICETFANEPRFMLDSQNKKEFSFSKSKLLITDRSYISNTFAYCTLHPSILFQPWLYKKGMEHFSENPIGYVAYTYKGLINCIKKIFKNPEIESKRILKNRNENIIPFETTFHDIEKDLSNFHNNITKPEWLNIDRNNDSILQTELELAKNILLPAVPIEFVSILACLARPDSHLIAALALHVGLLINPQNIMWQQFHKNIQTLLEKPILAKQYKDIDKEDILNLYKSAMQKAKKEKDLPKIDFIATLIESFMNVQQII